MWTRRGPCSCCSGPTPAPPTASPPRASTPTAGDPAGAPVGYRPSVSTSRRTLLVTNDFPPRPGGIQSFVHNLAVRRPPGSLVVYASTWRDPSAFDAEQPFPVVRENTGVLLPTPKVSRRAVALAREHGGRPSGSAGG